ncbi:MAG: MFS transporter [Armatimonadetes bacterium]|nr:MFS transporter [Armatimonadota bacterium]MBS1727870.1 MFS transporter [Armatimonadota bacterium]
MEDQSAESNYPRPDRLENLRTLRVANLDGSFATAFATLIGGGFIVGYIKTVAPGKGADLWIGLITSLPGFLGLIQIPGAIWGRSFPNYKGFIRIPAFIWRMLHIPIAILPLLALTADIKLGIILGCVSLAAAIINIVNPIYNDWLAEMIPGNSRGVFFANRNALMVAVGASVGLLGGYIVKKFQDIGMTSQGYSAVFSFAVVCAFTSWFFFSQMHDIPRAEPVKQNVKEAIKAFAVPFSDKDFRRVLLFLSIFIWGQAMAGNLWAAFAFESLKFNQLQLQFCAIMHAAGNISMSKLWGYLADKYGNKPLLMVGGFGMLLSPLAWLLARDTPGDQATTFNLVLLISSHFLMGANWSSVAICQFNLLLSTAKPSNRATYIGAGLATQSFISGVAPMVGAILLAEGRGFFTGFLAYHAVFWTTIGIRMIALFFLAPIREEGSTSIRETIRALKGVTPQGMRAMKRYTESDSAIKRESAIEKIAGQKLSLATSEMIDALHDPSPRVRRQAAAALGRLGDPAAVPELLHQLELHPDLVEEETVHALGEIGDMSAIPELTKLLQSPIPLLRRASLRAIAKIPGAAKSEEAIQSLIASAEDTRDPDLRRSALQALRYLDVPNIASTVSHALQDRHPSVRIAAAEASAELEIADTADACRASLALYDDEACAEVAYALGVNGNLDDVPRILAVAQTCVSMITRRRCLLGLARIYGVEKSLYRALMSSGMERDKLLISFLTVSGKKSRAATKALEAHSREDEDTAVRELNLGKDAEALTLFHVEELFVLAACIYADRMNKRAAKGKE